MRKVFCVIDGTAQIYRSFYAVKSLSTSSGFPTNAIYGFINTLNNISKQVKSDYICVVFDSPKPNFRHKIYKEYKATRTKPPDNLILQIAKIKEITQLLGVKILEVDGWEADDIIATLVNKFSKKVEFIIVSTDKDIMQLVNDNIRMFDVRTNEYLDKDKVKEKVGVSPQLIPSYLAIIGDNVDNIHGIHGIGHKRALEILSANISLEDMLRNPQFIPDKYKDLVIQSSDILRRNLELINLKLCSDFPYELENFLQLKADYQKLGIIYKELEFKKFLEAIPSEFKQSNLIFGTKTDDLIEPNRSYQLTSTENEIEKVDFEKLMHLSKSEISIYFNKQFEKIVISSGRCYTIIDTNKSMKSIVNSLMKRRIIYAYNVKEIFKFLKCFPIEIFPFRCDKSQNEKNNIEGREVCIKDIYLYDTILDPGFPKVPDRIFAMFSGKLTNFSSEFDINFCLNLKSIATFFEDKLVEKQKQLYDEVELPLSVVLADMEKTGILIDKVKLNQLSITFTKRLNELADDIFKIAGLRFNIDSPKQLQVVLYEKLKIKPGRKTKTGYSTDVGELVRISSIHPIGSRLLEYRMLSKLINTYIDGFGRYIMDDNRAHTTFIQGGTITGRLSTQDPNLQNIPIRTEEGRKIREIFIASEGYNLLSLDYSQIELRVLAHLCGEEKLIKSFKEDKDVHTETACTLFKKKPDEIDANMRRFAKSINFGIIYGMGPHGLAEQLGISHAESREFIESFFKNFPKVKKYIDEQLDKVRFSGYVENMFGRVRYVEHIKSANIHERSAAERIAINTPIQGTAADITKLGMINLYLYFVKNNVNARLLLQIHDEILLEYDQNYGQDFIEKCKFLMSNIEDLNLKVPLCVKTATGKSWSDL